jgi:ABC-2 type transport system permease protein
MTGYTVFVKKELNEFFKTSRWIVFSSLMLLCAAFGPVFTLVLPPLYESLEGFEMLAAMMEPRWLYSLLSFHENIMQIGIIMIAIMFASYIAGEKSKGTAIIMLSKNLSRSAFLISKLTVQIIIWTGYYIVSLAITLISTELLFNIEAENMFAAFTLAWLYGMFFITMTLFFSTLMKRTLPAALLVLAVWFFLSILSIIPYVREYSPAYQMGYFHRLLTGTGSFGDFAESFIVTVVLSVALVIASIYLINKKEV